MKEITHQLTKSETLDLAFGKPIKVISELGVINIVPTN